MKKNNVPYKEDLVRGKDLTNKHVVIDQQYFRGDDVRRVFFCESGFGCNPDTIGRAVFGVLVSRGERTRVERGEIARFATEEEVKQAEEIREKEKKLLVKFKHDWIEGFRFFTGEEWKNYVSLVENEIKFPRMQRMGSECIEYVWGKDYFKDIEVKEISEQEFYVLRNLFGDSCGCFGYFTL